MEHKTNALRMLDQKKIPHEVIDCGITEAVSGTEMAGIIGENGENGTNSNYGANGIATGATKSNYLCLSAALFATANYDTAVAEGGNA